jgi:sugar lactone lactonase YvrE
MDGMKMNRAVKIIIIILVVLIVAVAGFFLYIRVSAPHLFRFSDDVREEIITVNFNQLKDAHFVEGMKGCENIYLDDASTRVYVNDLSGCVHLLDGPSWKSMKIVKSKKVGTIALGIDKGPDGYLYLAASGHSLEEWMTKGGALYRVDQQLNSAVKITDDYSAINGMAFDSKGNLYFASCTFNVLHPDGRIFRMRVTAAGSTTPPEVFIDNAGLANGLYYDATAKLVYFSNTLEGIFTFSPESAQLRELYYKTRFMEGTDDLCTDRKGRVWAADPGNSFLKMYNPGKKVITRYVVEGIGQTSSCRIRMEKGKEIIYVTELKKVQGLVAQVFDGRGVVIMPLNSLTDLPR